MIAQSRSNFSIAFWSESKLSPRKGFFRMLKFSMTEALGPKAPPGYV